MTRRDPLAALLGVLLAACGGKADQASTSTDSGSDSELPGADSASSDSGLDAASQDSATGAAPACPGNAPVQGSECPAAGFACQYGTNVFEECVRIAACTVGGWSLTGPASTCLSSQCPPFPVGDASPGVPPCPTSLQGTDCWYPQGVCQCSNGIGGPAMPLGWYCMPVTPGCPYPTPAPGGACTQPGQRCGGYCGGMGVACDGGVWQANDSPCPV
jgi:hypothetical protein